jgi:hypothetical protein
MGSPKFQLPQIGELVHIVIGGAICLFVAYVLLSNSVVENLFIISGSLGVLVFQEAINALDIITFGVVYLPSGFLGGLYTGYKIKENLRVILLFPGIIGFVILTLLKIFSGNMNPSNIKLMGDIFISLLGSVIGSYLGGYTMNWETEEEKTEETGKIQLRQLPPIKIYPKYQSLQTNTLPL